jgi:hypothetical protein
VKPSFRKSRNSGSVVGQMDNTHLGRPLSPVNVHGRSAPSQIGTFPWFSLNLGLNDKTSR